MKFLSFFKSLTKFELILWLSSLVVICVSFFAVSTKDYLTLVASLIGATALIFVSKGNAVGQILTVVFSVLYGIISFTFRYYGEMITYLGMTAPIAVASVITWLKNPFKGAKLEVKVNKLKGKELILMFVAGVAVTIIFYFILRAFNTANLIISTVSVLTSFLASYLTMRRSELYAFAYALNDIVLIVLWILATLHDLSYLAMVVCFTVFLINDIYGFIHWSKMKKAQAVKIENQSLEA